MPATSKTPKPRKAATAQSMAKKQREISISEFFTKNRHLLGFDSPAKALMTTIKEAVDNSLDACEEAGILPDILVEIQQVAPVNGNGNGNGRTVEAASLELEPEKAAKRKGAPGPHQGRAVPGDRRGQWAGHRARPGAQDLRQAALRVEVS